MEGKSHPSKCSWPYSIIQVWRTPAGCAWLTPLSKCLLPPRGPDVLDDPLWVHYPGVHNQELLPPPILRGHSLPDHLPLMPHLGSRRHQTPTNQLMDLAFGIFNNTDRVEETKRIQGQQQKAVTGRGPNPCPQGFPPLRRSMVRTGSRKPASEPLSHWERICFKCGQEGHWKNECSLYGKSPPGPCTIDQEGHWKRDCPQSRRGLGALKPMMAERTKDWQGRGPGTLPSSPVTHGHFSGGALGNPWRGR